MKSYFWLAALLCCMHSAHAQTPLKTINYQAIIVDTSAIQTSGGANQALLYLKKDVWVKFGIFAGATLLFEELHKTKTDAYGLINLEIGAGENSGASGTFADLKWGGLAHKLVTKVSFDAGLKYIEISDRGFNYLPYAHFSEEAGKLSGILPLTAGGTGAEGSSGVKWAYQASKKIILHLQGDKIRMPQLASNLKGETALVYAEIKQDGDRYYKQIGFVVKDLSGKLTKSYVSDPAFDCSYPAIIWGGKSWIIAFEAVKEGENQGVLLISK